MGYESMTGPVMTRVETVYPFRTPVDPMSKPCPAVAQMWCHAPWQCAQPCTGRGGNSHAAHLQENPA